MHGVLIVDCVGGRYLCSCCFVSAVVDGMVIVVAMLMLVVVVCRRCLLCWLIRIGVILFTIAVVCQCCVCICGKGGWVKLLLVSSWVSWLLMGQLVGGWRGACMADALM